MNEPKPETLEAVLRKLTDPDPSNLYSRSEMISNPCPIPETGGLYAWYFKEIPPKVPTEGCIVKDGKTLLYIGISPARKNSNANLRSRIKTMHLKSIAEFSTLRFSLGVLLAEKSKFPLRMKIRERKTFTHPGEEWLNNWMEENAYVCWATHRAPREVEEKILKSRKVLLPLNIQSNRCNPFKKELLAMRKTAKNHAKTMPTVKE